MKDYWNNVGIEAKKAASILSLSTTQQKNQFLTFLYEEIVSHQQKILTVNAIDIKSAQKAHFDDAFIDRLSLNNLRIKNMADGVKEMIMLPDPIGEMSTIKTRPSGIKVGQMRVPLGVIAIIYESRPNVTIDAAALCLKSGNAAILRGGSEAFHTNQFLATLLQNALIKAGFPSKSIQIIKTTDRDLVDLMITSTQFVDVIIPRGGKSLIERIRDHARVPVIKHLDGICHTYIDQYADIEKALLVTENAKTQRYSPCNALETLLVHDEIAVEFLPRIAKILANKSVELRLCKNGQKIVNDYQIPSILATDDDWSTEYLAPIIAIKVVKSIEEAIQHINHFGSQHTDVIITENHTNAMNFLRAIDSACVMINASSRFCDGFEFGLGAEIGISTDKLHVRGPVGLEGLTSQKYIVFGNGETRK